MFNHSMIKKKEKMGYLMSNLEQINSPSGPLYEIQQNITTETPVYTVWFILKRYETSATPGQLKFCAWICHDLFSNFDGLTWEMSKVAAKFREENKIRFIRTKKSLYMSGFYHLHCQTIIYSRMISVNKEWKDALYLFFANTVIYRII